MQVRFATSLATAGQSYRKGRTYDLPDAMASAYIAAGVAAAIEPTPPQTAPNTDTPAPGQPSAPPRTPRARRKEKQQ